MRPVQWAYGVTTVPQRQHDLLPRTLTSLRAGGFPEPRLFLDGVGHLDAHIYQRAFELPISSLPPPNVRTFGRWVLALWELYLRQPEAQKYALFQDDLVCCRGFRVYLEQTTVHERAYWNCFTMPSNQSLVTTEQTGWFRGRLLNNGPPGFQTGRGAVALVFTREGVQTLLGSQHIAERPVDPDRGHRAVDGAIVSAMNKAGWHEMVHNPSLVQHTGLVSSMGSKPHPLAPSFRGEEWDACTLLGERAVGMD